MARLLLATDGSDAAVAAARRAVELVRPPDHVVLLTVVSPPVAAVAAPGMGAEGMPAPMATTGTAELDAALASEARSSLERTAAAVSDQVTGDLERQVAYGDPGTEICRVAAEGRFDLLVVGSHGHGLVRRVLTGSVTHHVVQHAPCPVLVVRRPD